MIVNIISCFLKIQFLKISNYLRWMIPSFSKYSVYHRALSFKIHYKN